MAKANIDKRNLYNTREQVVNHPQHYTQGNIECIDAMEAMLSKEEFTGYLKGNVMKYLWRSKLKGKELEDIDKAIWYLNKLRSNIE